jgi:sugar/nucleoside kinase (ribokinase family)
MKPTLTKAANGHLTLDFNDEFSADDWNEVWQQLLERHGFNLGSDFINGTGQMLRPSLVHEDFSLLTGWDCWSGFYLFSQSDAGDKFLEKFSINFI